MTSFCYFPELGVPLGGTYRMRKIVENVHGMSNKHAMSDSNRASGPNACLFANIAPVAKMNIPSMRKYSQLALDDAIFANRDPFAIARNIADAGRPT